MKVGARAHSAMRNVIGPPRKQGRLADMITRRGVVGIGAAVGVAAVAVRHARAQRRQVGR